MPDTQDGEILSGQQYDQNDNLLIPFTRQVKHYTGDPGETHVTGDEGNEATEIQPMDEKAAAVIEYDLEAIAEILDEASLTYADSADIQLPDILTGVTITYNKTNGDGADSHPADQQEFLSAGENVSGELNPTATAQGSAAIIPDAQPTIRRIWAQNMPVTVYVFYVPDNSDQTTILARLTVLAGATVNEWPVFQPESVVLTLKGMQVSVASRADSHARISLSSSSRSASREWGSGYSREVGVITRTLEIPPTLHAAITLTSTSDSIVATADVQANTVTISASGSAGTAQADAISNNPAAVTSTASASVTPTSISATEPTGIPATGLYLYRQTGDSYRFGYSKIRAIVFDFANIPTP